MLELMIKFQDEKILSANLNLNNLCMIQCIHSRFAFAYFREHHILILQERNQ